MFLLSKNAFFLAFYLFSIKSGEKFGDIKIISYFCGRVGANGKERA